MNKNELVAVVAAKAGLSKADAGKAVEAVFDGIEAALKKHGEFRNVGFGTFHVVKRAASIGRNPRTGEEIKISCFEAGEVQGRCGAEGVGQLSLRPIMRVSPAASSRRRPVAFRDQRKTQADGRLAQR